ncbi:MAG: bacteriohemerythrin [Mariprofundaceae bacterium]|nr:bacteriohemerythrin [Mariprofundaceae bacterium]
MSIMQEEIFPWNSNFETGITLIDEQHKKLVHLVNNIANHFAQSSRSHVIEQVLNELSDYTIYHFQSEEEIWDRFLPEEEETKSHQQNHQSFIDSIITFREELALSDQKVSHELLVFLTHWLSFHILDTDRHMANIVLAIQAGNNISDAKIIAQKKVNHSTQLLISTILNMYDTLSAKTLKLMREISKRQQAEQRLSLFKSAVDTSLEAIFITNHLGMIVDANPAFCARVHKTCDELRIYNIRQLTPSLFDANNIQKAWKHTDKYGHWAGEILASNQYGIQETAWLSLSSVTNSYGMISHYSGVLSSASSLIEQKNFLETEVNYDALTRLPNRRLFHERLKQAISNGERKQTKFTVCFLDLDGFKNVNDKHGHDAGDALLCAVSRQIEKAIRKTDSVARIGGDEFAILLEELNDLEDVKPVLLKVLEHIQKPVVIGSHIVHVSASLGVACYPHDGHTPKQLLKKADIAMYLAKKSGKSRIKFYHKQELICEK